MKSVLIVEDHAVIAELMRDFLQGWGEDILSHVCPDASSALALLNDERQDWFRIFLDLDIPGAYGLSLAKEIQRAGLHSRCCVVSAHKGRELIAEVQAMGFLGYIVKSSAYPQFVRSVACILKGDRSFPDPHERAHVSIRLTKRQEQLLDAVRRGLSSKEIAATCFLSEGSVNNALHATVRVLDAKNRAHAVARAIELGLLTMPHGDEAEAWGVMGRNAA